MSDPFTHAENTAHEWLAAVGARLGTSDDGYAYRMLRAWLHTVRDRLTAEDAAHFAAQLPVLLRGLFYEDWHPAFVPTRYGVLGFVARFAGSADTTRAEVPVAAVAVTTALHTLCRLDGILKLLPGEVAELISTETQNRKVSHQVADARGRFP
ncbi:DUF2267 domain-containing protein [Amycolatopsis sp. NPDC051903]|uniref:DUF2267 domain-containing protein n=1 Tax=Amycolatopsis sp. NPDC051903 TaxID=3363936 RepID=UPI0037A672DA